MSRLLLKFDRGEPISPFFYGLLWRLCAPWAGPIP